MSTDLVLLILAATVLFATAVFGCGAALAICADAPLARARWTIGTTLMVVGLGLFATVFWVAS